jgi:hypothetical protein
VLGLGGLVKALVRPAQSGRGRHGWPGQSRHGWWPARPGGAAVTGLGGSWCGRRGARHGQARLEATSARPGRLGRRRGQDARGPARPLPADHATGGGGAASTRLGKKTERHQGRRQEEEEEDDTWCPRVSDWERGYYG